MLKHEIFYILLQCFGLCTLVCFVDVAYRTSRDISVFLYCLCRLREFNANKCIVTPSGIKPNNYDSYQVKLDIRLQFIFVHNWNIVLNCYKCYSHVYYVHLARVRAVWRSALYANSQWSKIALAILYITTNQPHSIRNQIKCQHNTFTSISYFTLQLQCKFQIISNHNIFL